MRKLILGLALLVTAACTNPSMERGLDSLNASLLELTQAYDALNIPQMQADVDALNLEVATMIAAIDEFSVKQQEQIEANNAAVTALLAQLEGLLTQVQGVQEIVDGMVVESGGLATTEQVQALLADVLLFQAGVEQLVAAADYDSDGVINLLDKCPDTELGAAVDADGCSADQL